MRAKRDGVDWYNISYTHVCNITLTSFEEKQIDCGLWYKDENIRL